MARSIPGAMVPLVFALLTGCTRGPVNGLPAIPGLTRAPEASTRQDVLARAFDIHPGAAARAPMFSMPTPTYFDDGYVPSVTFVKNDGTLVEVHSSGRGYLWYHVGHLFRDTATWNEAQPLLIGKNGSQDDGTEPAVTSDGNGTIFEAHRGNSTSEKLYFRSGTDVNTKTVTWGKADWYASGYDPSLAFSGTNVILEAHARDHGLGAWSVGTIAGGAVTWRSTGVFSDAFRPSVAANSRGVALDVERDVTPYKTGDDFKYYHLAYRVGRVDANAGTVSWSGRHVIEFTSTILSSRLWSAALDDAGNVIVLYECTETERYGAKDKAYGWCTLTGKLGSDNTVSWVGAPILAPPMHYFIELLGLSSPSVTLQNGVAVGVAQQGTRGLFFATTMLTDRSNWMGDRLETTLKGKTLRKIVLPGSHDAGMYTGTAGALGLAQGQNFYDQLTGGQRYFDIRPDVNLNAWHGAGQGQGGYVTGASIQDILNDVKRYMQEGHRELVVLKFSHFTYNFFYSKQTYDRLKATIVNTLQPWLYDNKAVHNGTVRLADIPLSTMIPKDRGIVLPVMDLPGSLTTGSGYLYSYSDWYSKTDAKMQLSVYDVFADTTNLDDMQSDQLVKFYNFNGKMENFPNKPCDLFLLSWTLTPVIAIRASAAEADATLAPVMSRARSNTRGFVPNILFVDYYSWADPADLAIVENSL